MSDVIYPFLCVGMFLAAFLYAALYESTDTWSFHYSDHEIVVKNSPMGSRVLLDGREIATDARRERASVRHEFEVDGTTLAVTLHAEGTGRLVVRADVVRPALFDSRQQTGNTLPTPLHAVDAILVDLAGQPAEVRQAATDLRAALKVARQDLQRASSHATLHAALGDTEADQRVARAQARVDEIHTMIRELHLMATENGHLEAARASFSAARLRLAANREVGLRG